MAGRQPHGDHPRTILTAPAEGRRTESRRGSGGKIGEEFRRGGQLQKGQTWYQESQRNRDAHLASCDL